MFKKTSSCLKALLFVFVLLSFLELWTILSVYWLTNEIKLNNPFLVLKLITSLSLYKLFILPAIPAGLVLFILILIKLPTPPSLHGNAHFANLSELRQVATLTTIGEPLPKHSLILGKRGNQLISLPFTNHALLGAPSRSGKGVSIIIPNCLSWNESLIAVDIKGELFDLTSGFREKGLRQDVFNFCPLSSNTHCYNPLDYVDRDNIANKISDLQLISTIIFSDEESKYSFWVEEAKSIFLGLMLWLLGSSRPQTLGELAHLIKGTDNLAEFLEDILSKSIIADNLSTLDPTAYTEIRNFLDKAPKEQSGVKSTLTAKLTLWANPIVNAATSKSDFDLRDFRKKPMTVYIGAQTNAKFTQAARLFRLFIEQFVTLNSKELPHASSPVKVLFVGDEFCNLGEMPILKSGMSYLAGYNIHMLNVIQNTGQFFDVYGGRDKADLFFQNSDIRIWFSQNTLNDQKFVSSDLGNQTIKVKTRSLQQGRTNTNHSEQSRPLLLPEEVKSFPNDSLIVVIPNQEFSLKIKRLCYYTEHYFKNRLLPAIKIAAVTPIQPTIKISKSILKKEEIDLSHFDEFELPNNNLSEMI
jgi:type IV secretion system protein VirD4